MIRGRLRTGVGTRRLLIGLSVVALGVLPVVAACDSPAGGATSTRSATAAPHSVGAATWTEVPLPGGAQPVVVATAADGLVVGAYAAARPNPRMFVLDGSDPGGMAEVRLTPESPYAFEARWLAVAVHGDRVLAVGGARGGAHANVRWTVWSGTREKVVEQPQPFEVFGGWGAGDLSGAAFAGDVPVVSGGWASDRTGNDVALWRLTGERWNRQSSTGTPLGSTPAALKGARSMSGAGAGLVLAGSVTELEPGQVASVPAVWTAPSADGPWTLVTLQAGSNLAEAHGAHCASGRCLVVGQDGGRLAVWEVRGSTSTRVEVPAVQVGEDEQLPAPVLVDGAEVVVAPGVVLWRHGDGWVAQQGPDGRPTGAAAVGGTLFVVTTDASGTSRLFSLHTGS